MSIVQRWSYVIVLGAFGAAAALAQQSDATLSGTVMDPGGAIVPGVTITIMNTKTGVQNVTLSNESGVFISPPVPPGEYQVTAELPGFKKFVLTGVTLNTGDKVSVKVTLNVGELADSIDVRAEDAPILQYDSASIGRAITGTQVAQLP